MIYRLQRKFILVSVLAVLLVVAVIWVAITALNISSMNRNLDELTDRISVGGGNFPDLSGKGPFQKPDKPSPESSMSFITSETPFSSRYFTVWMNEDGEITRSNTEAIYAVDDELAAEYAQTVFEKGSERGWIASYRYKAVNHESETSIVFVDGTVTRSTTLQSLLISGLVLAAAAFVILLLIVIFSKQVMKPVAESYEKQKQFITDANHELKTPLTLILANLDIAESELGKNEWLDDIRFEGQRMTELVNQLVALTRMDEETESLHKTQFDLSEMMADTVSEFVSLAEQRKKRITVHIPQAITCTGDEALIRKLASILLDNAIKYCDENGEITVILKKSRYVTLTVENSYESVDSVEFDRLFDRFYRADKARTYAGGYGIGLSIAKTIAQKHNGDITAYKKDAAHIGFRVIFKG